MPRLFYSPASPYARKVRITALECGHELDNVLDIPIMDNSRVAETNPLGKVPALVLDDGTIFIDSPVICEYLDQMDRTPSLIPTGPDRFDVLRTQAMGDGILDAAVYMVMEGRRDESQRSPYWLDRWEQAIRRAVPIMTDMLADDDRFDLGTLTAVTALEYLDFRLPEHNFAPEGSPFRAKLAKHLDRPSVVSTRPA